MLRAPANRRSQPPTSNISRISVLVEIFRSSDSNEGVDSSSFSNGRHFKCFTMPTFVPRQRKHKAREREKRKSTTEPATNDSNVAEILPASKAEREEKRKKLREELRAQQTKISSKKQKRLDKYIETKLKKEENAELIKKLAETKVDTSLFQSSKKLGRVSESKRETLTRAFREKEAGVNVDEANALLYVQSAEGDESSSSDDATELTLLHPTSLPLEPHSTFGSGLKRPLEVDEDGRPVIKRRRRSELRKGFKPLPPVIDLLEEESDEEDEWRGFSPVSSVGQNELEPKEISHSRAIEEGEDSEDHSNTDLDQESDSSEAKDYLNQSESQDEIEDQPKKSKARTSAFKAWAEQQRNQALGFTPSNAVTDTPTLPQQPVNYEPQSVEQDPLPPELQTSAQSDRKAHAVQVDRSEEIQTARLALPVVAEEQKIMEAIFNNDVVIISGPTGSGKTTQVPQFLYEAGFGDPNGPTSGMIGVTQPRRVAAVSMAARVGQELGIAKARVAHQIRFDTTVGRGTAIKFMTDGVLLREISEDFTLKKYSAIIIDEAHERTVNTDVLIALMSRCVKARTQLSKDKPQQYTPLKLIIMSATLRVSDFRDNNQLFSHPPPLVQIEGRQYEVTPHWSRRTSHDYLEDMFNKVSRGHRKLPPGGILVFLTGQSEIQTMAHRLREAFGYAEGSHPRHLPVRVNPTEMPMEAEDLEYETSPALDLNAEDSEDGSESDIEITVNDDADNEFTIEGEESANLAKVHVLPLYSQLPSKEQLRVFEPPREGSRLIVLATNVAETSLTIPGIRYVFDSGRAKVRQWDAAGVQTFVTTWISKASADQRMGRAGRTGPGHCYRFYSSAVYESFQDFAEPEIFRSPLEGVVLQLKSLGLPRIDNFPFPTPPDRTALVKAEKALSHLGALDTNGKITPLGKELQRYPLNPRFSQMLRLGQMHNCIDLTIAMVALLDVPEISIPQSLIEHLPRSNSEKTLQFDAEDQEAALREDRRQRYNNTQAKASNWDRSSDAIKLVRTIYDYARIPEFEKDGFCTENFLRTKALKEAEQLRQQLHHIVRLQNPNAIRLYQPQLEKPSEKQLALLKQIVAAGFVDQVAIRADCLPNPPELERKPKRAIDVRYKTLFPSHEGPVDDDGDNFVYIHSSSVLAHTSLKSLPRYIVYQSLKRSAEKEGKKARVRMMPLCPVSGEQLAVLARGTSLLEVGKPLGRIVVKESVQGQERRESDIVVSLIGEKGGMAWPLARKRVLQRRVPGEGWVGERWLD